MSDGVLNMESPIWHLIALVVGSLLTLFITWLAKRSEFKSQAKRLFLEKRISRIEGLYEIFSEGQLISWMPPDKAYYQIFDSPVKISQWRNKLMVYANSNSLYFTKDILVEMVFYNNLLKQINRQIIVEDYSPEDLKLFCHKYFDEFQDIFSNTSSIIMNYFENEITINYKLNRPTEKDYKKAFMRLNKLRLIIENDLTQMYRV